VCGVVLGCVRRQEMQRLAVGTYLLLLVYNLLWLFNTPDYIEDCLNQLADFFVVD